MKKVIVSSSGGKDSNLALYKAIEMGYEVACIINTVSSDYQRVRFHGVRADVIEKQAAALEIPILQIETTPENYRGSYIENVKQLLVGQKIEGLVFGDIHLQDCFDWAKNICNELGVELIEPLWQISPEDILKEFINSDFEAVVVSTQENILDKNWVGRKLDGAFLQDISKLKGVDVCGENGEYHSLVLNGPTFKKKLRVTKSDKVLINGYWFLDVREVITEARTV